MILVTACYRIEARWITRRPGVRIVRTVVGERSRETMEQLGDEVTDASFLIASGFCGGVDPQIRKGQLFLARAVRHQGEEIRIDPDLLDRARQALDGGTAKHHSGLCASVDRVLQPDEKRALADDGVSAVDMETGPLARWATKSGLPFLALRVVLDPVDTDLPFSDDLPLWISVPLHPIAATRTAHEAIAASRALGEAIDTVVDAFAGRSNG